MILIYNARKKIMIFQHIHLRKTHTRLSIIFTIIVSITVCIIGLSFLAAQYYNDIRSEKRDFTSQVHMVTQLLEKRDNNTLLSLFPNITQMRMHT